MLALLHGFLLVSLVPKCWWALGLNNLANAQTTSSLHFFLNFLLFLCIHFPRCACNSHIYICNSESLLSVRHRELTAYWTCLRHAFLMKSQACCTFHFADFNHHLCRGLGARNTSITLITVFLSFSSDAKARQVCKLMSLRLWELFWFKALAFYCCMCCLKTSRRVVLSWPYGRMIWGEF